MLIEHNYLFILPQLLFSANLHWVIESKISWKFGSQLEPIITFNPKIISL